MAAYVGRRLSRNREGEGRPLDRGTGALLAGLAAVAGAWVGLAVAEAVAPSLPDRWQSALGKSDLAGLVRENDLLGEWRRRAEAGLHALLRAADGPGSTSRFASDPELRALVDDPRVRALIDEAKVAGRAEVSRSPEALRLLSDPTSGRAWRRRRNGWTVADRSDDLTGYLAFREPLPTSSMASEPGWRFSCAFSRFR